MIQLSKRLLAVAALLAGQTGGTGAVYAGNCGDTGCHSDILCVADVGTDHGYIPIYLVEQGSCKRAIAMDIRKGPLQRAKEHIEEHQLGAYIQTRLSDGLAALKNGEADAVVIAGMGGATMQGILEAGKDVITPGTVLVLQPQSEVAQFRNYLKENGFELLAEDMVCEDGKFYPMMKVQYVLQQECGGMERAEGPGRYPEESTLRQRRPGMADASALQQLGMMYGPLLLQHRHPVLKEFLLWQQAQKRKILANLEQNAATAIRNKRIGEIEAELVMTEQALKMYEEVQI